MKIILILLPVAALVCGAFTGNLTEVSGAVLDGAGNAVTLAISLCGIMCLWSGIMKVAEECGAVRLMSAVLSPVVSLLFRGLKKGGRAAQLIAMNLSANILGLGNATTQRGSQRQHDNSDCAQHREPAAYSRDCRSVTVGARG